MKKYFCGFAIILIAFTSCVNTYQIKKTEPDSSNSASVTIHRKGILNFGSPVKIYLNDNFVGQVAAGRYLRLAIPPGEYIVKAKSLANSSYFTLNTAASKHYLLDLRHKMRLANIVDISVSEKEFNPDDSRQPTVKMNK